MAGFELVKLHDLSNLSATYLPYNIPSSLLSVYLTSISVSLFQGVILLLGKANWLCYCKLQLLSRVLVVQVVQYCCRAFIRLPTDYSMHDSMLFVMT